MNEDTNRQGNSTSTATTGLSKTSTVFIRRMQPEPVYRKPELTEAERAMMRRLEGRKNDGVGEGVTWE